MPDIAVVNAIPVEDLLASSQGPSIGSTATSLLAGSNGITASQTQSTRHLRETSSTTVHGSTAIFGEKLVQNVAVPVYAVSADGLDVAGDSETNVLVTRSLSDNKSPASSTRTSVSTQDEGDSETFHQSTHTQSLAPFPKISKLPNKTLEPSITVDNLNLKTPSGEVVLANGTSTNTPSRAIDTQLGLVFGTQSITANSKSQYIFSSGQILSLGFTSTLDSIIPTSVPAPGTSGSQSLLASGSSTSLPPYVTTLPDFFKSPPTLIINNQTLTADSLGHYLLDNQTISRGSVVTVSVTKISLAPNASDVVVGTSTDALRPSFTAGFGSGANGTKVQKFSGDALGARDGLWGSSLMLLVSFFVLLWF